MINIIEDEYVRLCLYKIHIYFFFFLNCIYTLVKQLSSNTVVNTGDNFVWATVMYYDVYVSR